MVNYRRNKTGNPDDILFFTIVTMNRLPRFAEPEMRDLALTVLKRIKKRFGFKVKAWVILPDHLHLLISPQVSDYSKIIFSFKKGLSMEFKRLGRIERGEKMWQDRFWEETVKDDDHFERCVSYILHNPIKHGLVETPVDWKHSSIHEFIRKGDVARERGDGRDIIIPGAEYD